VTPWNISS